MTFLYEGQRGPHQDGSATNRSRNSFSVQKPFGSSKIGHRSERFCVFLPIFAGRDGEGNEQKFGEEGDQAKQWSLCFEKSASTRQVLVV